MKGLNDVKHLNSGLTEDERREAIYEAQRMRQRETLGERWICHPSKAPQKGSYNPLTGVKLS
jgi:hypothetical protein